MATRISDRAFVLVAAGAAVLFAADALIVRQIDGLRHETAGLERSVVVQLSRLRQVAAVTNDTHHDGIESLAAELVAAKFEAVAAAGNARTEAQQYAQRLARRLVRTRRQEQAWVEDELISLRAVTVAANEATRRLERQVREARSAAFAARHTSATAGAETSGLSSDLRAVAQLAARQRNELAAATGAAARDVFEFELRKPGEPQQVAGLTLLLRKADPKRKRYSIEIVAGTSRIEANDRTAHEPVRLYAALERRPLELVVNEIGKDEIRGFVAVPRPAEVALRYSSGSAEIENFPVR